MTFGIIMTFYIKENLLNDFWNSVESTDIKEKILKENFLKEFLLKENLLNMSAREHTMEFRRMGLQGCLQLERPCLSFIRIPECSWK